MNNHQWKKNKRMRQGITILLVCVMVTNSMILCAKEYSIQDFYEISASGNAGASGNMSESGDASASGNAKQDVNEIFDDSKSAADDKSSGIVHCIMDTLGEVKRDALKPYKKYYKSSVTVKKSKYILSTRNYNQNSLNSKFKTKYKTRANGTCSMVAGTSAAEYYTRKGYAKTLSDSKRDEIFSSMVLIAYGCGAYDGHSTYNYSFYKVIKKYYEMYRRYGYGSNKYFGNADIVETYNRRAKPVIGHFSSSNQGHSMVIAGYYDVTVKYQKNKKDKVSKETIRYYVVNDGWHNASSGDNRISYINSKYLKKGVTILK